MRPALPKQGRLSQKNMDETLKRCVGFTDSQLALDWDIVRDAADDGDDEMRVAYYNMSAEADKSLTSRLNNRVLEHYTRALPYLRDAAANGYADAYLSMGDVYAKGILQSADLTLAYAYKLAWLERLRAESAYPNEVSQFSVGLEREFADLSNAQRLQASAYAQAILRGEVL
ncbi:MAG: hypothetical protein ABI411_00935 [Tahibacter sp.]